MYRFIKYDLSIAINFRIAPRLHSDYIWIYRARSIRNRINLRSKAEQSRFVALDKSTYMCTLKGEITREYARGDDADDALRLSSIFLIANRCMRNLADRHNVWRFDSGVRFAALATTKAAAERFVAPVRVPRRRERRTVCAAAGQRARFVCVRTRDSRNPASPSSSRIHQSVMP